VYVDCGLNMKPPKSDRLTLFAQVDNAETNLD